MIRRREESGFVAMELACGIALLVVPVAMVVLTLPRWSERQATARVIAREVARRTARDARCDEAGVRTLGRTMARDLGVAPGDVDVALQCVDGTALVPGTDVEARVTVSMPGVQIPAFGSVGSWSWTAGHREPVDRYVSAR